MAEVAGSVLAVPAGSVRRVARMHDVTTERFGGEPIARLEGEAYQLADLGSVLGLPVDTPPPPDPPVLFVESGGHRAALVAHEVGTHQEVVVKPTGTHLVSARGVAGATLLQDGRVALLLHLPDILGRRWSAVASVPRFEPGAAVPARPSLAAAAVGLRVLVVDDSPTIRKLLVRMLKDLGWSPAEAKDGVEALERVRTHRPDVVLADIEMPRMDGYGLLAALRAQPETEDLPVVMLTSRAAARHRDQAMALGASSYLTKPYRPEDVAAALRQFAVPAPAVA
jgi:chemosensory pili system protein ChpA (sensor histidine kinase/response regulator)